MRSWQHSHNLRLTTQDRLNGVLGEVRAERASLQGRSLSADEQAELQRVDKALSLIEAALAALGG